MGFIYIFSSALLLVWSLLGLGCWNSDDGDGRCLRPWDVSRAEEVAGRQESEFTGEIVDLADPNKRLNVTNTTANKEDRCEKSEAEKPGQSGGDQLGDHDYVDHVLGEQEEYPQTNGAKRKEQGGSGGEGGVQSATPKHPQPTEKMATFEEWTKEKLQRANGRASPVIAASVALTGDPSTGTNQTAQVLPTAANESLRNASSVEATARLEEKYLPVAEGVQRDGTKGADYAASRNYASRECGAKVLVANEESENKAAVLNDKERDDYMRNPCEKAREKFLVVELCDSIRLTAFEVANFELFSSGPKAMRLWASERYPTAEWSLVAEFEAENTREIHSFPIATHASFAKFVKLELLTHHGQEHYCTLSTIRAYGVDEWDVTMSRVGAESQNQRLPPTETVSADINNEGDPVGVIKSVINNLGSIISNIEVLPKALLPSVENNSTSSLETPPTRLLDKCWQCAPTDWRRRGESHWLCHTFAHSNFTPNPNMVPAPATSEARVRRRIDQQKHETGCRDAVTPAQRLFLNSIRTKKLATNTCNLHGREPPKSQTFASTNSSEREPQVETNAPTPSPIETSSPHKHVAKGGSNSDIPLPGATTSQKEKALMTLHKRLTALELNMSLSQEYLNELSRRYVAQSDTWAKQHELLLKNAEDAAAEVVRRHERVLREEVSALRTDLEALRAEMSKYGAVFKSMRSAMLSRLIGPSSPSSKSLVVRTTPAGSENDAEGKSCKAQSGEDEELRTTSSPTEHVDFTHYWIMIAAAVGSQILVVLLVCTIIVLWRRCSAAPGEAMSEEAVKGIVREECERAVSSAIAQLSTVQRLRLPDEGKAARRRKQRRPLTTPQLAVAADQPLTGDGQRSRVLEESGDSAVETATNSSSLTISSHSSVQGVATISSRTRQQPSRLGSELEASELEAPRIPHQSIISDTTPSIRGAQPRLSIVSLVESTSVEADGRNSVTSGGSMWPVWQLVGRARRKLSADSHTQPPPPANKTRSQPRPLARCPEERK